MSGAPAACHSGQGQLSLLPKDPVTKWRSGYQAIRPHAHLHMPYPFSLLHVTNLKDFADHRKDPLEGST